MQESRSGEYPGRFLMGAGPVLGKTRDLVVFGPAGQQSAFPKEEFRDFKGSKERVALHG